MQIATGASVHPGINPCNVPTGIDWKEADYESEDGRKEIATAVSDYLSELKAPNTARCMSEKEIALKTTRSGHTPNNLPRSTDLDVRFYGPFEDLALLDVFRYIDKRESKNPTYKFGNVSAQSIVFQEAKPGEPARIQKVTDSSPTSIESVTYHGALGIDDEARRFDEYMVFEQNLQRVPQVYNDKMVDIHAALITALGSGINESFSTDLATTINNGCIQILDDVGDVYSLSDSVQFALIYNHNHVQQVSKMFASRYGAPNDSVSTSQVEFNVTPIRTRKLSGESPYLTIFGLDNVTVEWDSLFSEYGRDYMRGVDAFVYRARLNAAIGNTSLWRRIATS